MEALRLRLWNRTPFFGNDDDRADAADARVYDSLYAAIDGQANTKGTVYHLNMLSTTCHVYFGKMLGATPNGRLAHLPESDGTSPSQGADRNGPTAVIKSLSKMDQIKSGGTLLNQRFLPSVLATDQDLDKLGAPHPHLLHPRRPPHPVQRGRQPRPCARPRNIPTTTATCWCGWPATATTSSISTANTRKRSSAGPNRRSVRKLSYHVIPSAAGPSCPPDELSVISPESTSASGW